MSCECGCLDIKVILEDETINIPLEFGQPVEHIVAPDTYTGPVTVTPSETEQVLQTKDKLLTDNVTVNPIPSEYVDAKTDYDSALTAFGVESDLADGISALTEYSNEITGEADETLSDAVRSLADMAVEEWDGILYPADEEGRFNVKWLYLEAGDAVEVEFYGRGGRIWAFSLSAGRDYPSTNRGENPAQMGVNNKGVSNEYCYMKMRMRINPVTGPCIFSAAGYEWVGDGTHSTNDAYVFFGEYYKYKIIHSE